MYTYTYSSCSVTHELFNSFDGFINVCVHQGLLNRKFGEQFYPSKIAHTDSLLMINTQRIVFCIHICEPALTRPLAKSVVIIYKAESKFQH